MTVQQWQKLTEIVHSSVVPFEKAYFQMEYVKKPLSEDKLKNLQEFPDSVSFTPETVRGAPITYLTSYSPFRFDEESFESEGYSS
jgi:hypothetical protein